MTSKIIAINVGTGPLDLGDFYKLPPTHPETKTISELPMLCFYFEHAGRLILIDAAALPTGALAEQFPMNEPFLPPLLAQLEQHGIPADGITDLIITHTHWDHYNGLTQEIDGQLVPAFPNARHIIHTADWNPDSFEDLENQTLKIIEEYDLLTLIEGKFELINGITIIPAPGETPGHQIIEMHIDDQFHYFCGDLFHNAIEFDDFSINVPWAEPVAMQASKLATLTKAANNGGWLYFSHIEGAFQVFKNNDKFVFKKQQ